MYRNQSIFMTWVNNVKNEFQIDRVLDLRGWSCPWCIVKAKSWLNRMEPGQILELLGTDSETLKNFPSILRSGNDRIIEIKQYPDYHRLLIRRG
jgi:tRNA 2-thiouridine synthesizing protein A